MKMGATHAIGRQRSDSPARRWRRTDAAKLECIPKGAPPTQPASPSIPLRELVASSMSHLWGDGIVDVVNRRNQFVPRATQSLHGHSRSRRALLGNQRGDTGSSYVDVLVLRTVADSNAADALTFDLKRQATAHRRLDPEARDCNGQ